LYLGLHYEFLVSDDEDPREPAPEPEPEPEGPVDLAALDERELEINLDPDLRDVDETHEWVTVEWNPEEPPPVAGNSTCLQRLKETPIRCQ